MATVALFTDESVLAVGFAATLADSSEFQVLPVCRTLLELQETAFRLKPDIVVIDLAAGEDFGAMMRLPRELPECQFVLWTRDISAEMAHQALHSGVRGILRKTLTSELVIRCLSDVCAGELCFDKTLTDMMLGAKMISLTRRESQLVALLAQGLKNKEIAAALSLSEGTVKVYFSRLFEKVGAKDRFELALYGLRNLNPLTSASPAETPAPPNVIRFALGGQAHHAAA